MKSTTNLRTITFRGLALESVTDPGSIKVARSQGRRAGSQDLIIDIITGAYRATLSEDCRLTTERAGEVVDLGQYRIIWQGHLPRWMGDNCEAFSELVLDYVDVEIKAGRHGLVDFDDMPVEISRGALKRLVQQVSGRIEMSKDLASAVEEADQAIA